MQQHAAPCSISGCRPLRCGKRLRACWLCPSDAGEPGGPSGLGIHRRAVWRRVRLKVQAPFLWRCQSKIPISRYFDVFHVQLQCIQDSRAGWRSYFLLEGIGHLWKLLRPVSCMTWLKCIKISQRQIIFLKLIVDSDRGYIYIYIHIHTYMCILTCFYDSWKGVTAYVCIFLHNGLPTNIHDWSELATLRMFATGS